MAEQELEVKFYINDLAALENRLKKAGGSLVYPRTFEINLRYDNPAGELSRNHRVLRLRQDTAAVLTYKGPSQAREDVSARQEIEVIVSDFTAAQHLLEALGMVVVFLYEKQRTTYDLNGVKVTLDEVPFGHFIEVEGPDAETIKAVAKKLDVSWDARSTSSYSAIFGLLKAKKKLSFNDMTFANFQNITITPEDLDMIPAD
ncbi:MAG: class IV adenylate cyclase [Anaerolineaceae bacterium]